MDIDSAPKKQLNKSQSVWSSRKGDQQVLSFPPFDSTLSSHLSTLFDSITANMAPRNKDEESMHSVDREDGEAEDMEVKKTL